MIGALKRSLNRVIAPLGYELRRRPAERSGSPANYPFLRHFEFSGLCFDLWIANAEADLWYRTENWESIVEFAQLRVLATPGSRVLEIGTHHGFTTLLLAQFVGPGGFVLGVEALPRNALCAGAQFTLNRIAHAQILNAAGADVAGRVALWDDQNAFVAAPGEAPPLEVPAVTADDLTRAHGPFDLLKIDVEGFEARVLAGARELLRTRPKLALELHLDLLSRFGTSAADIWRLIEADAYEGTMMWAAEKTTARRFAARDLPAHGIVNLFLTPKK